MSYHVLFISLSDWTTLGNGTNGTRKGRELRGQLLFLIADTSYPVVAIILSLFVLRCIYEGTTRGTGSCASRLLLYVRHLSVCFWTGGFRLGFGLCVIGEPGVWATAGVMFRGRTGTSRCMLPELLFHPIVVAFSGKRHAQYGTVAVALLPEESGNESERWASLEKGG